MRCAFLVAWREFVENVKTKGFWLGIFLFPAILVFAGSVPLILSKKAVPTRHFVLVDFDGKYAPAIRAELARQRDAELGDALKTHARRAPYTEPFASFVRPASTNGTVWHGGELDLVRWKADAGTNWLAVPGFVPPRPGLLERPLPPGLENAAALAELEARLRPWLRGETLLPAGDGIPATKLFAAVVIPTGYGPGATNAIDFWCENQADTGLRDLVQRRLGEEFRHSEYRRLGLDPAVVARIDALRAPIVSLDPRKAAGEERVGLSDLLRQWAPSFFVYLLWVAIFAVSQMLLNSVIEEKSNRIIEVLLSSVTPGELMMGKLAGVAAVGAVMLAAWIGSLVAVALFQVSHFAGGAAPDSPVATLPADVIALVRTTWLLPAFAFYFIAGFLLYAGVFLTIGSLCNTLKEAQNFMGPIMLVLMVPLFLMPFIPRDPNGPIATFLSWIPWYTPFVMMNRITAHPPARDVVGTAVLLAGFTALVLWGCGRIFRMAILRTGQPPRLVEMFRWIRGR